MLIIGGRGYHKDNFDLKKNTKQQLEEIGQTKEEQLERGKWAKSEGT